MQIKFKETGQSIRSIWVTDEKGSYDKWQVNINGNWVDTNDTYIDIRDGMYKIKGTDKDWKEFCKKYQK